MRLAADTHRDLRIRTGPRVGPGVANGTLTAAKHIGGPDGKLMPFRSIEDPARLRRVLEAVLLIEADLELPVLLRHIVEEARSMTNARYGALGVLDQEGKALAEFITVGMAPAEETRIGPRPTGRGILGRIISHPEPLRLAEIGVHPESAGFPPDHPPMTSFLGVPIRIRDDVYGNLYLTDKLGWSEFTSDDEALVASLALAAGIAIENAQLHRRASTLAVYEERDRVARDLHDHVIQRLFAVGLSLQSIATAPPSAGTNERLAKAVADIDDTIRQVRTSIFELGAQGTQRSLREDTISLLRELAPVTGFEVRASFDGPVDTAVPDLVAEHTLAVVREAVTNIGKHAEASSAEVELRVANGVLMVLVIDDGRGLGASRPDTGGLGLANLRRRAEKLHGRFEAGSGPSGGTHLTWQVPLSD